MSALPKKFPRLASVEEALHSPLITEILHTKANKVAQEIQAKKQTISLSANSYPVIDKTKHQDSLAVESKGKSTKEFVQDEEWKSEHQRLNPFS